MKQFVYIAMAALCGVLVIGRVQAQQGKGKSPKAPAKAVAKDDGMVAVSLGSSGLTGGTISKRAFDSLAAQGLRLDPKWGAIQSFLFVYAEKSLYEDSVGNPLITTDYLSEYCYGDTLSPGVKESLFDRTKPGDTAYFNSIRIVGAKGEALKGRPMMFVLRP